MNTTTQFIFTHEVYPYVSCSDYEKLHTLTKDNKTFFVHIPYNALSKPGKRPRIGAYQVKIFEKQEIRPMNESIYRIIIQRIGRGKLYLYSGGSIRELTDDTISRNTARHAIRVSLSLQDYDTRTDDAIEQRELETYIEHVRETRKRERDYIQDSRPVRRHKCNQHARVDCAGYHYASLGNYVTSVKASPTARVTVKKTY